MSISLQGHPFPKDTEPSDVPKEQAEKIKAVETTGFKFVGWKTEDSPDEDDQYYHGIAILRKGSNTFMAVFPDGDSGLVRDEHAMESGENSEKIAYDVDEAVAAPPDEKKVDGLGMIAFVGPKNKAKAKQTKNYGHITSAEDYIDALKKIGIEAKPTDWVVYFPESRARLGGGKMKSIDEMLAKLSVEEVDPVFSKVGGIASPSAFDKNISTNEQREIVKMYKRKGFTPVAKVDRNAEHGVGVGLVPGPKSNWPIPIGDGDVVIVYPDGHVIEYYSDGNVNEIPADSIDEMLAKLQKETGDAPEDEDKYDVADLLYDDNSRKIFDDSVDRHNVDDFDYDITSVQGPEKDVGITHSYIEEVAFAEVKFHVDLSDFQERTVRPIEVNDILAILDKWSEEKWPVVFRGRIKAHDNQDDVIADAMVVMELNSKNTTVKKRAAEGAVFDIRVYEKRPEIDQ